MPAGMWMLFKKQFQKALVVDLGYDLSDAKSNTATKIFCRMGGKKKFSASDIEGMKKTAALKAGDGNPYSWNMDYLPYDDGSGYEAKA